MSATHAIPNSLVPKVSNTDFLRQEILRIYQKAPMGFNSQSQQRRISEAIEAWVKREAVDPIGIDGEVKRLRAALHASEGARTDLAITLGQRDRTITAMQDDPKFNPFKQQLEQKELELEAVRPAVELAKYMKNSVGVLDEILKFLKGVRSKSASIDRPEA